MMEKKATKLRSQTSKDRIFQQIPHFLKKHLETITIALGTLGTAKASWDTAKEPRSDLIGS
jgi:hypothetical protein